MKPALLFALLLLACGAGHSQDLPKESVPVLQAALPTADLRQSQWVLGDLNGDGLADLALLAVRPVHDKDLGREIPTLRLVVLLRTRDGFRLAAQSLDWERHERRADSIHISKGVLSYATEGSSSCCARYADELKFKLRDGVFVLIGQESVEAGQDSSDKTFSARTSINFLTKQVIRSGTGSRKADTGKQQFSEDPIPLPKFSYYTYQDQFKSSALKPR